MTTATDDTKGAWIAAFLSYLKNERRLSVHTINNYRRDLEGIRREHHEHCPQEWQQWRNHHVRNLMAQLHQGGLSGRSIQRKLSALRSFFRYLIREDQIKHNPAQGIRAPKTPHHLPDTLSVDQIQQLLNNQDNKPLLVRDIAMLELFYSSGLRLAELAGLDLHNIDLQQSLVRVLGKGSKTRIVPIGRMAQTALQRWLKLRPQYAEIANNALFLARNGNRLSHRSIQQRIKIFSKKQGLTGKMHPHMLRHSFASHLLESCGDLRAVQELLGHANINTTQIYTHLNFQHLAQSYDQAHPRARKGKTNNPT